MANFIERPIGMPFQEDFADTLQAEQLRAGGMLGYVTNLHTQYGRLSILQNIAEIAHTIEPFDPDLGTDPQLPYARAYYAGCLLGLRCAELTLPHDFAHALQGYRITMPELPVDDPDYQRARDGWASYFVELGRAGIALLPKRFESFFDRHEPSITPNANHQFYVRRGVGLVARYTDEALQRQSYQRDFAHFKRECKQLRGLQRRGMFDWDDDFRKIQPEIPEA